MSSAANQIRFTRVLAGTIGILVACLVGLGSVAQAADRTAVNVDGHAFLEGQLNHAGIQVFFEAASPTAHDETVFTDALGSFHTLLNFGNYTIHYTKDGYLPYDITIARLIYTDTVVEDVTLHPGSVIEIPAGELTGTLFSGNLYRINGDVSVPAGQSLVLQSRVRVEFMGFYGLTVDGTLTALGTQADSIFITSGKNPAGAGDWKSLALQSGGTVSLSYVSIRYAQTAVQVRINTRSCHL